MPIQVGQALEPFPEEWVFYVDNSGEFVDAVCCVGVLAVKVKDRSGCAAGLRTALEEAGFAGNLHFKKLRRTGGDHGRAARLVLDKFRGGKETGPIFHLSLLRASHPRYEQQRFGSLGLPPHIVQHNYWVASAIRSVCSYFLGGRGVLLNIVLDQRAAALNCKPGSRGYPVEDYLKRECTSELVRVAQVSFLNAEGSVLRLEDSVLHAESDLLTGALRQVFAERGSKEPIKRDLARVALELVLDARSGGALRRRFSIGGFPDDLGRFASLVRCSDEEFMSWLPPRWTDRARISGDLRCGLPTLSRRV